MTKETKDEHQRTSSEREPPSEEPASEEPPSEQPTSFKEWPDVSTAPGDDVVKLKVVQVGDFQGCPVESLSTTQPASVEIEFVVLQGARYLQPVLMFTDALGNTLFWSTDTNPGPRRTPMDKGRGQILHADPG